MQNLVVTSTVKKGHIKMSDWKRLLLKCEQAFSIFKWVLLHDFHLMLPQDLEKLPYSH